MKKIAIEEHFWTEEYQNYLRSRRDYPRIETVEDENHNKVERLCISPFITQVSNPHLNSKLLDMGPGRLAEMPEGMRGYSSRYGGEDDSASSRRFSFF